MAVCFYHREVIGRWGAEFHWQISFFDEGGFDGRGTVEQWPFRICMPRISRNLFHALSMLTGITGSLRIIYGRVFHCARRRKWKVDNYWLQDFVGVASLTAPL
ncbi:uncharacterized protein BDR25DRAFT_73405 [Lindgomyces ingoldianus]|uniref:Uncharacterized protein n=1 Tax=Lindgomyces ingoldianus TaxID=673940 RepID=A0ACB6QJP1_9PLEO|nr:uncharacterized protein BDR25DRAFT_73405 [Lindgomyces ingoldianus]KAF2467115.1 hypothetical protein BDR25DRAFT_73405 [Lindgomyces ingoldianus]